MVHYTIRSHGTLKCQLLSPEKLIWFSIKMATRFDFDFTQGILRNSDRSPPWVKCQQFWEPLGLAQ